MQSDDIEARIRAALPQIRRGATPGKSYSGLAKLLGIDPSAIAKIATGERRVHLDEVATICTYLGIDRPSATASLISALPSGKVVHVVGILANQVWREAGMDIVSDTPLIAAVLDPRYAAMKQYALRVDGPCEPYARAGDYAIFVAYADVRKKPQHGDVVHVRREQGHLHEDTLRKIAIENGHAILTPLPLSGTARVQLNANGTAKDLEIVGLCISVHRPLT